MISDFSSAFESARGNKPGRRRFGSSKAGQATDSENRIGLKPTEGWRKRNLQFLGDVLIPTLLAPRKPGCTFGTVPEVSSGKVAVTWLGHAGFFIQIGGFNIIVDPNWALWMGPVKRVRHPSVWAKDLPPADLVLVTHAHFDHLHLPSLHKIAAAQPIVVPTGVGSLVKRCGFGKIIELETWQSTHVGDIKVSLTPARHWGARMIHDVHRGFGGYLIEANGESVFHCGDSSQFDGFQSIGKRSDIDVALMPIGAYQAPSGRPVHMNPEEALDAFEMLGARNIVPMHHDTFPLGGEPIHEPVQRLVDGASRRGYADRLRVLNEGESAIF